MSAVTPLNFDAVLFDLDGTLADSAADIALALRRAFNDLRMDVPQGVEGLVDGSPLEEVFAAAAPDAAPEALDRFVTAYRAHYAAGEHRLTRLYPGVVETLEALDILRPRLRVAVATAKRAESARALVATLGIARYFDRVDGSGGTPLRPKPSPDLLLATASALGAAPQRTLMVGDTLRDVYAGRAAGMRTAVVLYGLGAPDVLLAARPDYVLEDIEDVLALVGVGTREPA